MPTFIPAELSAWLSERRSDLHDALINGDSGPCSRAHHGDVRRGRMLGGNDRKDVTLTMRINRTCRTVTKWSLRGVRVGEAANPDPASKRRTQRLRALQRSMDSDSENDRPLASTGPEVFAMSDRVGSVAGDPTPQFVLCQMGGVDQPLSRVVGGRRLVLLPQSSGGTPQSVCDRSSVDDETAPFRGPQDARSTAVFHNRFTPLDDGQEAADAGDHWSQCDESDTETLVSLSSSVGLNFDGGSRGGD